MPTTQCAHYWIIETADGPVSKGECQLCGEEREFSNSAGFMATNGFVEWMGGGVKLEG